MACRNRLSSTSVYKIIRVANESSVTHADFGKPPGKTQIETIVQIDII